MANVRWKGKALAVAQVSTITVGGTWVNGETATLTINGRNLVLTVGATVTTAAIATALKEMWNGDTITGDATRSETGNNVPEFDEVTATVSGSVVTLTGDTKGKPFTLTVSETSPSGTLTLATTTAATGPNHWDNAQNWDTGAVPVSTDTVYLDNSDVSVKYGLAQSAVTLTALHIGQSFSGDVGLPESNADGTEYLEYRDQYLAIGVTTLTIGRGEGNGSGRLKINTGSVQTALTIEDGAAGTDSDLPAVIWKGTHISNTVTVRGNGTFGAAAFGAETATIATLSVEGSAEVICSSGVTLTTVTVHGGTVSLASAVTTLTVRDGEVTVDGAGAVTTANVWGGTLVYNSSGALGTATVGEAGQIDFSQDPGTKTVTNPIDAYNIDPVLDPDQTVTNLRIDYNGLAPLASLGTNVRLTRGTPS